MKLTRRSIIVSLTAMSCTSREDAENLPGLSANRLRLAICNNTFQGSTFEQACQGAARAGYTGLEIAPGTLHEDPASVTASRRAEIRRAMDSEGLTFVGLHNLLGAPKGLHITTPDDAVRRRSWEYFRRLIDLCADLGSGGGMVLGSGKQRDALPGTSREDARNRVRDGLANLAPHAAARGVVLLPETLAPHLSNILTSMEETISLVREIDSPAVQTLFDTHNAVAETLPHDELIERYAAHIRHVHVNEMDGRHPGTGNYDFGNLLGALRRISYAGWVSLEVFHFEPSGDEIARASAEYLRSVAPAG
jgi:D-psicose/D-tagatose/L-ribulose 3-epimerase